MINKLEPPINEIRQVLNFVWKVLEHGPDPSDPPIMGALNKVEHWAWKANNWERSIPSNKEADAKPFSAD